MTGEKQSLAFDPDWVIAPGETLREWMEERGLSAGVTAKICGAMPVDKFERILTGRQRITKDIAARLEHGTCIPAFLWLNLERNYRAGLAQGKKDTTDA